jgi:hypothetical protein
LDVCQSVLSSDISKNVILCDYGFVVTEEIERNAISSELMPERPEWYKTIRLIHRCCVKYLCGKLDIAQGLADEVRTALDTLTNQRIDESDSIKQQMKNAFQALENNYLVDQSISKLLGTLFQAMDDMEELN